MTQHMHLLADIGASHSRLALAHGGRLRRDTLQSFRNDDIAAPLDMLARFCTRAGHAITSAAIAAAGPLGDQAIRLTNRPDWSLSRADLAAAIGIAPQSLLLLNDLQAMGHALAVPEIAGSPLTQTRLVLAIGTGLNAAVAHRAHGAVFVPPGESGHAALPFTTAEDAALFQALAAQTQAPVLETVLSGPGLSRAHLALTGQARSGAEITSGAPGTARTLALALRVLGASLGSLALTHLPHGGIYLAGAAGRALFDHLDSPEFRRHFFARGPYDALLEQFPLRVIRDDTAPLHGLAHRLAHGLGHGLAHDLAHGLATPGRG